MNILTLSEPWEVRNRLADLGLEEEPLRNVVRRGYLAYITCTANHPPLIPPIWAWGETVRALREYVLPLGWRRSDENNYSVVIDSEDQVAIAVATGDEGTGRTDALPSNKARKGPSTINAVNANQLQLELQLFTGQESNPVPAQPIDSNVDRMTWVLLIHRTVDEVCCELSLPFSIAQDGHINQWRERILLKSVPLDGDLIEVVPPTQPDITIEVKRRA
ncbi:hypothetical protein ACTRXD_07350 [Nitrospira sp. T9]|uniref:hypothetical protein n=1 Tax=unclassified Nitrospira TaxID=2652172 RepID=UPI003F9D7923